MADPFSVAGGTVGVISLALTVARGLIDYYDAWKDCGEDVRSTFSSLQDLWSTLEILRSKLTQDRGIENLASHLDKTVISCADAIAKLDKKLREIQRNGRPSQFERLRYPFRRGTLGKLQDLDHRLAWESAIVAWGIPD